VFTTAVHSSLSWARCTQSTPSHPLSPRSILILSYHLRLSLPNCVSPSCFPTKILYAFLISLIHPTQTRRSNMSKRDTSFLSLKTLHRKYYLKLSRWILPVKSLCKKHRLLNSACTFGKGWEEIIMFNPRHPSDWYNMRRPSSVSKRS
jgi:hypothetical protein